MKIKVIFQNNVVLQPFPEYSSACHKGVILEMPASLGEMNSVAFVWDAQSRTCLELVNVQEVGQGHRINGIAPGLCSPVQLRVHLSAFSM